MPRTASDGSDVGVAVERHLTRGRSLVHHQTLVHIGRVTEAVEAGIQGLRVDRVTAAATAATAAATATFAPVAGRTHRTWRRSRPATRCGGDAAAHAARATRHTAENTTEQPRGLRGLRLRLRRVTRAHHAGPVGHVRGDGERVEEHLSVLLAPRGRALSTLGSAHAGADGRRVPPSAGRRRTCTKEARLSRARCAFRAASTRGPTERRRSLAPAPATTRFGLPLTQTPLACWHASAVIGVLTVALVATPSHHPSVSRAGYEHRRHAVLPSARTGDDVG
jgi:hypothetical protein